MTLPPWPMYRRSPLRWQPARDFDIVGEESTSARQSSPVAGGKAKKKKWTVVVDRLESCQAASTLLDEIRRDRTSTVATSCELTETKHRHSGRIVSYEHAVNVLQQQFWNRILIMKISYVLTWKAAYVEIINKTYECHRWNDIIISNWVRCVFSLEWCGRTFTDSWVTLRLV